MTKAQQEFIARIESSDLPPTDARDFLTWYHPEDIHRIAYTLYQEQPAKTKDIIHFPYMILGSEAHSFTEKMAFCRHILEESDKQVFPFIIAPEIGAAHFMAGFIIKTDDEPKLFLFNPTGYTQESAKRRLDIKDLEDVAGMQMHLSPTKVQTIKKDQVDGKKGPALVSCGPISLMFIEYLLKNPQYIQHLDKKFVLPEPMNQLEQMSKTEYQHYITNLRKAHYQRLGTIADEHLEQIDSANYQLTGKFLDEDWREISEDDWEAVSDWDEIDDERSDPIEDKISNQTTDTQAHKTEQSTAVESPLIQLEKEKFAALLAQLKVKTDELIKKGGKKSPYHKRYAKAKEAAENLIRALEDAGTEFFPEDANTGKPHKQINAATFETFKTKCGNAIEAAKKEFKNHRGWWHTLNPIVKGFIGVLATLTAIPAVMVLGFSKHGYTNTFFKTPQTDSMTQIGSFETKLSEYCTNDLSSKIK